MRRPLSVGSSIIHGAWRRRRSHVIRVSAMAIAAVLGCAYAQSGIEPLNDLPNPFRTVRDWGHPPNGAPWAAVTAVEVSPDGSIYVIHRCHDNSCAGRPEPPI